MKLQILSRAARSDRPNALKAEVGSRAVLRGADLRDGRSGLAVENGNSPKLHD
jgi:hypothetical protein